MGLVHGSQSNDKLTMVKGGTKVISEAERRGKHDRPVPRTMSVVPAGPQRIAGARLSAVSRELLSEMRRVFGRWFGARGAKQARPRWPMPPASPAKRGARQNEPPALGRHGRAPGASRRWFVGSPIPMSPSFHRRKNTQGHLPMDFHPLAAD